MIKPGQIYRHYKGHVYQILCIARHSETLEELVIYQQVDDKDKIWGRPLAIFEEKLADGHPRFELLENGI